MNLIALVDCKWGIAKAGRQICTIPDDLQRFKELTMGCPIVLGRKTLLNFPDGKPLTGRNNYILSRKIGIMDDATICRDISELQEEVLKYGWCVGGESVYRQLLPYCDHAYITCVDADLGADQFCPDLDASPDWELGHSSETMTFYSLTYQFREYRRKRWMAQ